MIRAHILIEREDGSVRHTILEKVTDATVTIKDQVPAEPTVAWLEGTIVSTFDYPGTPDEPGGAARVKPVVSWERIEPRERTDAEQHAVVVAAAQARADQDAQRR